MAVTALNWEAVHLHGEAWISHHRLRHRIFVERQNWTVPNYNGLEYDQFDTPAAIYLLWLDRQRLARGVVRLIPTTQPYMVKILWPELMNHTPPQSPWIWEATRFGCDHDLEPTLRRRVIAELICACQEFAIHRGIEAFIGVMPHAIFRHVIIKHGCPVTYAGPSKSLAQHLISAAYIGASREVLQEVRRRTGIAGAVLEEAARRLPTPLCDANPPPRFETPCLWDAPASS